MTSDQTQQTRIKNLKAEREVLRKEVEKMKNKIRELKAKNAILGGRHD